MKESDELKQNVLRLSVPVVTLFLENWNAGTSSYVVQGRCSGCAVDACHVISLAHFPNNSIPDRILVARSLYAPDVENLEYLVGKVIVPTHWTDQSPILIKLEDNIFTTWLQPALDDLPRDAPLYIIGYNAPSRAEDLKHYYENLKQASHTTTDNSMSFLLSYPVLEPSATLVSEYTHPYHKSVAPGNVLGSSGSGVLYVSATAANGCSGAPVFTHPTQGSTFSALLWGGKHHFNANIVIPTTHPSFTTAWEELKTKLNS